MYRMLNNTVFLPMSLTHGFIRSLFVNGRSHTQQSVAPALYSEMTYTPQEISNTSVSFNISFPHLFRSMRYFASSYFDDVLVYNRNKEGKPEIYVH